MISQSACLYQKLMCSFSISFSFSYSYVPYSASIYPVHKLCTASSGKIARFPNAFLIWFYIILKLVIFILASSTMAATNSVFMEVLTGNSHWFAEKLLHIHIYQTNNLTGIVSWPHYFPPFHLTNGEEFLQSSLCLLHILKLFFGSQKLVLQQDADALSLCGHTLANFSALLEVENISQNSGYPHFGNSIRNISIKIHRL